MGKFSQVVAIEIRATGKIQVLTQTVGTIAGTQAGTANKGQPGEHASRTQRQHDVMVQ
ncbi:hypothetical protein D3C85_1564350 [compost metagenome]